LLLVFYMGIGVGVDGGADCLLGHSIQQLGGDDLTLLGGDGDEDGLGQADGPGDTDEHLKRHLVADCAAGLQVQPDLWQAEAVLEQLVLGVQALPVLTCFHIKGFRAKYK
jgi:hypothetical protein